MITLSEQQLVDTVHSYLSIVVTNDAMRAVSEADDDEIGSEVVEHWEHQHGALDDECHDDVVALMRLGRYVVKVAREIVRLTTPPPPEPDPAPPAPSHPGLADPPLPPPSTLGDPGFPGRVHRSTGGF